MWTSLNDTQQKSLKVACYLYAIPLDHAGWSRPLSVLYNSSQKTQGMKWTMFFFCFFSLTCILTPSPFIIWCHLIYFNVPLVTSLNSFLTYTPPFCKANRHWIRHGKHTPLYGRYHPSCHFFGLLCTSPLPLFWLLSIKIPFPQRKWVLFPWLFLVLLTSTWLIHRCCFSAFLFNVSLLHNFLLL